MTKKTLPHILVARVFLIEPYARRILIMQRAPSNSHNPLKWEVPGGKVECGETPLHAIHRELAEETGLTEVEIDLSERPAVQSYIIRSGDQAGALYVAHFYVATMGPTDGSASSPALNLSPEHQEGAWIRYKEFSNYELTAVTKGALLQFKSPLSRS